jgi:hypothetical protein
VLELQFLPLDHTYLELQEKRPENIDCGEQNAAVEGDNQGEKADGDMTPVRNALSLHGRAYIPEWE